ncbi:MAG: winged helix-turn-helix domain-containing protein, partial [Betaproteobacteria bacterium]
MNAPGPRCYAFGRFRLDPLRGRLTNGGAAIDLRPKSLAVLQYLVSHPHRPIAKDELLDAVWDKVVVTEDSLVQCVREIRQALDDPDHELVRTIPRSGYMFVAPVKEEPPVGFMEASSPSSVPLDDASSPSVHPSVVQQPARRVLRAGANRWTAAVALAAFAVFGLAWVVVPRDVEDRQGAWGVNGGASRALPPLSIVVLPLLNIDGDPAHEYFAHGFANDLTTDLGRIPTSLVISHSSARAYGGTQVDYKKVGRELGVRYAIEGSVQRLGDDVRVNVRLIETDSGAQRWAERFDGPRSELPHMQANIVRRIAQTLQVQLLEAEADRSARERTTNPDAQDLLMRGWALWERRQPADNAQARELFAKALIADPK